MLEMSWWGERDQVKIRARFTKEEPVRFISHLDLARTVERAVRRGLAGGLQPNPGRRSPLVRHWRGITSSAEYVDMEFSDGLGLMNSWEPSMKSAPGIRFKKQKVSLGYCPLMSVIDQAQYIITGDRAEVEFHRSFSRSKQRRDLD